MRYIQIPKKNKGFRTCVSPNQKERIVLNGILGKLNLLQEKLCDENVVYGFMRGKSPVNMAKRHIGYEYTISMDLENFFDTVTENKVRNVLSREILDVCLVEVNGVKCAAQGLPTSPAIANIAAIPLDTAILKFFSKNGYAVSYTRYADDLTFSYNDKNLREIIMTEIPQIINRCNFKININKTRYMPQGAGNRVICGISVNKDGIAPMREHKRKLRAANHMSAKFPFVKLFNNSKSGLASWCELNEPTKKEYNNSLETYTTLVNGWKLGNVYTKANHNDGDELKKGDFLITRDPAYILGMSAYTNGWGSCMGPSGASFRKVNFWIKSNSKIACLLHSSTNNYFGVERRNMSARTLIHELEDGTKVYDRIYGNSDNAKQILMTYLNVLGYVDVKSKRGMAVKGLIRYHKMPFLDSLSREEVFVGNKKYTKLVVR